VASVTLTDQAANVLAEALYESPLSDGAGLRIWRNALDDSLTLRCSFTEGPIQADDIVDQEGARLFLDAEISPLLDGRTIDLDAQSGSLALVIIDGDGLTAD
jgi:iron-sulfur cluster assembly protein